MNSRGSMVGSQIKWYRQPETLELRCLMTVGTFVAHELQVVPDDNVSAFAVDFDGDGDRDLVVAGYSVISWYENLPGEGIASTPVVVADDPILPRLFRELEAADVDGDGDIDLVTIGSVIRGRHPYTTELGWLENRDGEFSYLSLQQGFDFVGITRLAIADFDLDGRPDIVTNIFGHFFDINGLTVYSSQDNGLLSQALQIDGFNTELVTSDIDRDSNLDILLRTASQYQWVDVFSGEIISQFDASYGAPEYLETVDLDGDGDLDVVSLESDDDFVRRFQWYENTNGNGEFEVRQLGSGADNTANSLFVSDLDGDGDADLITHHGTEATGYSIHVHDNLGQIRFRSSDVVSVRSAWCAIDMDGDGDLDIVSEAYHDQRLIWYENQLPIVGDSNGDGLFSSADLVLAFQSGEYEDDVEINSTFEEGDWNGDGDFDSSDLVFVFQAGSYSTAAKPISRAAVVDTIFEQRRAFTADLMQMPPGKSSIEDVGKLSENLSTPSDSPTWNR